MLFPLWQIRKWKTRETNFFTEIWSGKIRIWTHFWCADDFRAHGPSPPSHLAWSTPVQSPGLEHTVGLHDSPRPGPRVSHEPWMCVPFQLNTFGQAWEWGEDDRAGDLGSGRWEGQIDHPRLGSCLQLNACSFHTHCCFRDSDENQVKRLNVNGASFFRFDYSSWKELLVNVWMWKHYCIWLWDVLCSGFIWTGRDACWSPSSGVHPLQPRVSLRDLIEVPPNSEDLRLHFSFSLTNYMNSKK